MANLGSQCWVIHHRPTINHPTEFREGRSGGFVLSSNGDDYPTAFLILSSSIPDTATTFDGDE